MNAEGTHTDADISNIRKLQGGRCAYCRARLNGGGHLDHIQPLARGGTNWPANLQLTCQPCNNRKHAKDPITFAQGLGLLL
jgi:5-methylcytosine-specific restriction endonuclease McrA